MDLSQQELPLTSYFTRANKESRSCVVHNNAGEDSQSVASKRKRGPSVAKSRPTTLQLPTPATSVRKRLRGELPGVTVDRDAILSSKKDHERPEFGCTPSKLLQSSRESVQDALFELPSTSLTTPSIDRRTTTKPKDMMLFVAGIATPQTSSRQALEPRNRVEYSPLAFSNHRPLSKPKPSVLCASLPQPKTMDGHDIPTIPVPSSQSQYLLHPDATPKRKRHSHRIECVVSSQTQEERELTLSSSLRPVGMIHSSTPRKHISRGNPQTPCLSHSAKCQHICSGSSPACWRNNIQTSPSRASPTRKASAERQKILAYPYSPTRKTRPPRGLTRHDSVKNIPPSHLEDSLTESESDTDIHQLLRLPLVSRGGCSPKSRGFAQGNLPSTEDGSATELESDTEILHCVAEIGKKRLCERHPEASRENAQPPPVISPLVSPTRPRIATIPLAVDPLQFFARDNPGPSAPGIPTTSPSNNVDQYRTYSESFPSVVRDFIHMFPGDESYPADFPESLRI